jgi:hypothetical protein
MKIINNLKFFLLIAMFFCEQVFAAGQIEMIEGTVTIISAKGESRTPQKGEAVSEGDTLITGRNGELHVRLDDNGLIALRANTRLKIEAYRAQGDNEDKAFFSLLKGTFRSVTGWIGRYNAKNYGIKTPTATIGVRGTDHEPLVVTDPEPGEVVTLAPGTYDKVNTGITVLGNKFGTTLLNPNQAGFAPKSAPPKPLTQIPDVFKPTKNETAIDKNKELLNKGLELRLKDRQQDLIKKRSTEEQPGKILPKLLGDIKAGDVNPGKQIIGKELVPAITPAIRDIDLGIPGVKTLPGQLNTQPQMIEPGKLPVLTPPGPVLTPMVTPTTTLPSPGIKTPTISPVMSPVVTPMLSAPISIIRTAPISTPIAPVAPMRMLAK